MSHSRFSLMKASVERGGKTDAIKGRFFVLFKLRGGGGFSSNFAITCATDWGGSSGLDGGLVDRDIIFDRIKDDLDSASMAL